MQHDYVMKKLSFDMLTQSQWLGGRGRIGGLRAKYKNNCYDVAAFVIPFNLICNMTMHDLKTLNFLPFYLQGRGGGSVGKNICYHVVAFVITFNLLGNMTML